MITRVYNGNITLGPYSADKWYGINDLNHPKNQIIIEQILMKPELLEGFEIYVVGGILEGWLTWDIDLAIIGPYEPKKIKKIMHHMCSIGFENGIYPDVTYADKVFDLHDWQKTGHCDSRWLYRLSNYFSKDGEIFNMKNYQVTDEGLFKYFSMCPLPKNVEKDADGHKYKKPVRIF